MIISQPSGNIPFHNQAKQTIERYQKIVDERQRVREKVDLEQLLVKTYWDKIHELNIYTRQKQLQAAYIREGQLIDIEVK